MGRRGPQQAPLVERLLKHDRRSLTALRSATVVDRASLSGDPALVNMLRAFDDSSLASLIHLNGPCQTWSQEQIYGVRRGLEARVRAGKVCECGRYKNPAARVCTSCFAVTRARPPRRCTNCGREFSSRNRLCCSSACRDARRAANIIHMRKDEAVRTVGERRRRRRKDQRRRHRGLRKVIGRWRAICERDAWTCWICGGPIARRHRNDDPLSPSVDHVVPLALGGTDDDENLKAAHRGCNSRRGARGTSHGQIVSGAPNGA